MINAAAVTFGQTVDGNFSLAVNTTGAILFSRGTPGSGENKTPSLTLGTVTGRTFTLSYNGVNSQLASRSRAQRQPDGHQVEANLNTNGALSRQRHGHWTLTAGHSTF